MVISRGAKALAWVAVILMNVFFVYFSLLRGLERGIEWQRLFLVAALIQIVIELCFYETTECAMVHYYIPNLARKEVQTVGFLLHQAIQSICTDSVASSPLVLDAPRYLFVSTNLANRFPDLFESVVIKSYHTYSPGELAKKWKVSHASTFIPFLASSSIASRVRRATFSSFFFSLMQRIGAMPPTFQRLAIQTIQPMIVAAFFMVLVYIISNPEYLSIVGFLLLVKSYMMYREYKEGTLESALAIVHPMASSMTGTGNVRKRVDRVMSPGKIQCELEDEENGMSWSECSDLNATKIVEDVRPAEELYSDGALNSPVADSAPSVREESKKEDIVRTLGDVDRDIDILPPSRQIMMWDSSSEDVEHREVALFSHDLDSELDSLSDVFGTAPGWWPNELSSASDSDKK